jgi:hypothetical protein
MKAGPGRPKGSANKATKELKDMILASLDAVGGLEYLKERATDPKTASAYMALIGKVLPLQVTGEGGGPMVIEIVKFGDK